MIRWTVGLVLDAVLALRESGATAVSIRLGPLALEAAFPDVEEEDEAAHVGMGFQLEPDADEGAAVEEEDEEEGRIGFRGR